MGTTALSPLPKPPVDVPALAKMPLAQLANLPAEPGIYLAIDDANRVWYVGIADCIRERLGAHDRKADFIDRGATAIAWLPEHNLARRRSLEKDLIEFFHPPLNMQHNFNALPSMDLGLTPNEEIERFFRLRVQLKLIELELELLKPNIITRCEQAANNKILHNMGTITRQVYKTWQFSVETERKNEALKLARQAEKDNGTATVKSISVSPIARLNASVLAEEIAILVSSIDKAEEAEALLEAAI